MLLDADAGLKSQKVSARGQSCLGLLLLLPHLKNVRIEQDQLASFFDLLLGYHQVQTLLHLLDHLQLVVYSVNTLFALMIFLSDLEFHLMA